MRRCVVKTCETPVKKGDIVMVMNGKESGKTGKIIEVLPKKERVLVEKLNFVKRHSKPTQTHKQGGVIEKEASIHWSNVALMCAKCNKPSRKRIQKDKTGKKARICTKCGEQFEITS